MDSIFPGFIQEPGGTGGGGISGVNVQDDGSLIGQFATLNFACELLAQNQGGVAEIKTKITRSAVYAGYV